jgi:A/G-specific adenine glycosylase
MIDDTTIRAFREEVWEHYRTHGRHDLPWRRPPFDAYRIAVSELMLQQTQASRVIPKYAGFLKRFPSVRDLAAAPLGDVLLAWSGLGYNRRAKFLWQAARQVTAEYDGAFPRDLKALIALPGIGHNTAGAILAYAWNEPAVFVETNIRTVFIHHFFDDQSGVSDKVVTKLVAATLDREHPREWYWALMDYGVHLKKAVGNLNRLSKSYVRQSAFEGSRRQVRGQVLRALGAGPRTLAALREQIPDERLPAVLDDLLREELVSRRGRTYRL